MNITDLDNLWFSPEQKKRLLEEICPIISYCSKFTCMLEQCLSFAIGYSPTTNNQHFLNAISIYDAQRPIVEEKITGFIFKKKTKVTIGTEYLILEKWVPIIIGCCAQQADLALGWKKVTVTPEWTSDRYSSFKSRKDWETENKELVKLQ